MAKCEQYLPAGSSLVVRPKNSSEPRWHRTTRDVVVAAWQDAACPLTDEPARSAVVEGLRVWFKPFMLRERWVPEAGEVSPELAGASLSIVHYDVPRRTGYSPCAELYRVAVPMSESVWLVRTGDVPYNLVGAILDMGGNAEPIALDPSETPKRVAAAIGELRKRVAEAVARNERSLADAHAKLLRSEGDEVDEAEARDAYERQVKAIDKRLEKLKADMELGATRFGLAATAYGSAALGDARVCIKAQIGRAHV